MGGKTDEKCFNLVPSKNRVPDNHTFYNTQCKAQIPGMCVHQVILKCVREPFTIYRLLYKLEAVFEKKVEESGIDGAERELSLV